MIDCNYVDDNNHNIVTDDIDDLIKLLEQASVVLFQWFDDNSFSDNPTKWSKTLKQFVGCLDWKLNFDDHISDVC